MPAAKNTKGNYQLMKKFFFVICAILECGVIAFFVLAVISGAVKRGEILFFFSFVLTAALFLAISLKCLSRCREGREKLVRNSILMKTAVLFTGISFAFLDFEDGIYAFALFFILGLIFGGISLTVIKGSQRAGKTAGPVRAEKYSFSLRGKEERAAAAAEYMRLKGIPRTGDLTEKQKEVIESYAAVPFSYMFYWLAVSGALNGRFTAEFGRYGLIEDMQSRKITASEALDRIGFSFGSEYMKEEFISFFRTYYDTKGIFGIRDNYIYDYYEASGEPDDRYYCMDFSWETCGALEKKIGERFSEWKREFGTGPDASYYDNGSVGRTVHTELFGADLELRLCGKKRKGFPDDYGERCLEDLDGLTERQLRKLERLFESEYGEGEEPGITRIETFRPDSLYMFEPEEEGDVVFALSGEAEFEPEHGISFTVRNGTVLNWAFASDIEEPYSRENRRKYETEPSFDISEVRSPEDAKALLQSGDLVWVKLVFGIPHCSVKGGEDYVYLTPEALREREKYERYILNIRAFSGIPDLEMVYVPEYYTGSDGKALSLVPKDIYIRTADTKGGVKAFFRINVWN